MHSSSKLFSPLSLQTPMGVAKPIHQFELSSSDCLHGNQGWMLKSFKGARCLCCTLKRSSCSRWCSLLQCKWEWPAWPQGLVRATQCRDTCQLTLAQITEPASVSGLLCVSIRLIRTETKTEGNCVKRLLKLGSKCSHHLLKYPPER